MRAQELPKRSSSRIASDTKWWDVGKAVEIFVDGEWWQAKVLKTQAGLVPGEAEIYVSYVGGTEDENEWVPVRPSKARSVDAVALRALSARVCVLTCVACWTGWLVLSLRMRASAVLRVSVGCVASYACC